MRTQQKSAPDDGRSLLIDKGTLCRDYRLSPSKISRCIADGMLPAPVRSGHAGRRSGTGSAPMSSWRSGTGLGMRRPRRDRAVRSPQGRTEPAPRA